eukprot:5414090-Amphidinium_carterae.2
MPPHPAIDQMEDDIVHVQNKIGTEVPVEVPSVPTEPVPTIPTKAIPKKANLRHLHLRCQMTVFQFQKLDQQSHAVQQVPEQQVQQVPVQQVQLVPATPQSAMKEDVQIKEPVVDKIPTAMINSDEVCGIEQGVSPPRSNSGVD